MRALAARVFWLPYELLVRLGEAVEDNLLHLDFDPDELADQYVATVERLRREGKLPPLPGAA